MMSFGTLGRYFSVHMKEDCTELSVLGFTGAEAEPEGWETACIDIET